MARVPRKRPAAVSPVSRFPYATPEEVKQMRHALRMSQARFAVFLETHTSCVGEWERGESKMPCGLSKLARIAADPAAYRRMVQQLPAPTAVMRARLRARPLVQDEESKPEKPLI